MKFYIASGLKNFERVQKVRDALVNFGHTQTYDWTAHGDIRQEGAEKMELVALRELSAVIDADLVIVLLPGGNGTHTEIGAAISSASLDAKKRVWLWSESGGDFAFDERTTAFYFHPTIEQKKGSIDSLIACLEKEL